MVLYYIWVMQNFVHQQYLLQMALLPINFTAELLLGAKVGCSSHSASITLLPKKLGLS